MLLFALVNPISVHAATGQVSVNGGVPVTSAQTDTAVSVPIQISGGDGLNAFDIQVFADPTILQVASVSITPSLLGSASIVLECLNGVLVSGTVCSAQDGSGVVHLAAAQTGALVTPPAAPALATLFTINYKIVGQTTGTPISFNTGCTKTSTGTSDCVSIGNGGSTLNSETDLGTTFSNLIDFSLKPAFSSVSTPSGVAINDQVNLASLGGYSDAVALTCFASAGQTCSLNPTSVTLVTTASSVLTVTGSSSGPVTVNATGTGACLCPIKSHVTTISVTIAAPDFSIAVSKSSVTVARGTSDSSVNVNLAGKSSFSGTVTISSPGDAGITATAPVATLTPDGSGFSKASSALTVTVGSSTAIGDHLITITGMVGTTSHSTTLTVTVPGQDFSIFAVPNAITIVRGGSAASNINIFSNGNFATTITFTATTSPVTGQQDSCCLTNNITPAFNPATVTLSAGGSTSVAFFASTIGGAAPPASYTSTGNYTATVTATGGGHTHSLVITFTVQDFALLQSFCDASTSSNPTFVDTSPNANQDPAGLGSPCDTLTITTESGLQDPGGLPNQNVLWVQTGAFGGLVTDGFNGTPSVAALNPQVDPRGSLVPALKAVLPGNPKFGPIPLKMCLLQTFWPNGTQIPYTYLRANGPLISPGVGLYAFLSELVNHDKFSSNFGNAVIPAGFSNWGCKFDAQAFPNDQGVQELNDFEIAACDHDPITGHCTDSDKAADIAATGTFDINECADIGCPFPTVNNNPDFLTITAMTIPGLTLPGAYTFKLCGQIGVLVHCTIYHLDVILPPLISDLHWNNSPSVSHNRAVTFGVGMYNPDALPLYFQAVISATGDNGNSFTVTSNVILVASGTNIENVKIPSILFGPADIGATFSFSVVILAGATPTGLTASSSDVTTLFLGSGLNSGSVVIKP